MSKKTSIVVIGFVSLVSFQFRFPISRNISLLATHSQHVDPIKKIIPVVYFDFPKCQSEKEMDLYAGKSKMITKMQCTEITLPNNALVTFSKPCQK